MLARCNTICLLLILFCQVKVDAVRHPVLVYTIVNMVNTSPARAVTDMSTATKIKCQSKNVRKIKCGMTTLRNVTLILVRPVLNLVMQVSVYDLS